MIKTIKLHLKYLFNKNNYLILSIVLLIIVVSLIIISEPFSSYDEKWFYQTNFQESYYRTSMSVIKMLIILFSCFLFGNCFLPQYDNYVVLLVRDIQSRIKYFIAKIVAILVILIVVNVTIYAIYISVGKLFIVNFHLNSHSTLNYAKLFCQALGYGALATLMILIFRNSLGYIIPYVIYISLEIINSDSNYPPYLGIIIYGSCFVIFTIWSLMQYIRKNL